MEEDEIDKMKLPVARKRAKNENIDISNLQNIGEIRCSLKRHLLRDRKSRVEVRLYVWTIFYFHFVNSEI